jgi:putative transposase
MYLVAIIDLYIRYVVGWSLSNSMDATWCKQTLEQATEENGKPEILNTDQGSQFTAEEFSPSVLKQGIRLSMDGKGRAKDNAFIERQWRNFKYEKIYLNPPSDGLDPYVQVAEYFHYYNTKRRHQSFNYEIPQTRNLKAA